MLIPRRASALFLQLSLVLAPVTVRAADAQPATDDVGAQDVRSKLRGLIDAALDAFNAARYEESARIYMDAYQLLEAHQLPAPSEILFNAGLAYEKSGACDLAVELFERFRERSSKAPIDPSFTEHLRQAEECAPEVKIDSTPSHASLSIDGTPRGVTPLEVHLRSGAHTLDLALQGYLPLRGYVTIAPGRSLGVRYGLQPRSPPEPAVLETEAEEPSTRRTWMWVGGGLAVAALATGVALFAGERAAVGRYRDEVSKGPDLADEERARDAKGRATDFAIGARAAFAVAAGGLAAAGVLFLLPRENPTVSPKGSGTAATGQNRNDAGSGGAALLEVSPLSVSLKMSF